MLQYARDDAKFLVDALSEDKKFNFVMTSHDRRNAFTGWRKTYAGSESTHSRLTNAERAIASALAF